MKMGRIKVVHVITRFDKGGSAENTFLTVKGLNKERYDILLIRGVSDEFIMSDEERRAVEQNLDELQNAGIRVITLRYLIRNIDPFHDIRVLWALFSLFRKERPHIVHTHTSKAGILGRWAARFARVPVIVHTPHGHVFWGYFNRLISAFYRTLETITASITDRIIALTEREKKEHVELKIAAEEKFSVVHSGIALDIFLHHSGDPVSIRGSLRLPPHGTVVGTIGRLTPIKGHSFLIASAAKVLKDHPDTYFVLLGDGELRGELQDKVSSLGIGDSLRFLGWRNDVADILSVYDIFVFPSLNEGMGKALVEAMAMGKPVIASSVGGILDLISPEMNGLLVPPADPTALAEAIGVFLRNPERGHAMGNESRKMALSFSAESMVIKIDRIYLELLSAKSILRDDLDAPDVQ